MTAHDEALTIIERGNLGYHEGCALIAILEGDLDKAATHIERRRGLRQGASIIKQIAHAEPPQTRVVPRQLPAPAMKRGGTGSSTSRKVCSTCGEKKNSRAFRGSGDTCTKCQNGGKRKMGGVKPKPAVNDAPAKRRGRPPKAKPAEAPALRPVVNRDPTLPDGPYRKCSSCGKVYQLTGFPDRTKAVCKYCAGSAGARE